MGSFTYITPYCFSKKKIFIKYYKKKNYIPFFFFFYLLYLKVKFFKFFLFLFIHVPFRFFHFNFYLFELFSGITKTKNFFSLQKFFHQFSLSIDQDTFFSASKGFNFLFFLKNSNDFSKYLSFRSNLIYELNNFNFNFMLFLTIFSKFIQISLRSGLKTKVLILLNGAFSSKQFTFYSLFFNLLSFLLVKDLPFNFYPKRFGKNYIQIPNLLKYWVYFLNSFQFLHVKFLTEQVYTDSSGLFFFYQNLNIDKKFSQFFELFERGFDRMGRLRIVRRKRRLKPYDVAGLRFKKKDTLSKLIKPVELLASDKEFLYLDYVKRNIERTYRLEKRRIKNNKNK